MKPLVCIDAGHGGHDSGAVGPTGLQEKAVALKVAKILGGILERRCSVLYTRTGDTFVELAERAAIANRQRATIFVSIHCNSGPPGQGSGFEVWTTPGQTESDRLAQLTFESYGDEFESLGRRMDLSDGDADKEASFAVLRLTKMPAILFELEFIHTTRGEAWLAFAGHQTRAAEALARGIFRFLGLKDAAAYAPSPAPVQAPQSKWSDAEIKSVAGIWQAMYATGKVEEQIAAAKDETLCLLHDYLVTQDGAVTWLALGLIENQMIDRFMKTTKGGANA